MQNLIHISAGQTRGQRPQIDSQGKVLGRDASAVSIRVATPDDEGKLRRMFHRLSPETIYRRFHIPYPDVPERTLALMLDADHHDKESLVALAEGEIIAHAMYARGGDGGDAEVAFVVEDGWQSKGVGQLLLSELSERAKLGGVETFTGEVLGENWRVLGLLNAVFAEVGYVIRGGLYHVRVPLRTLEPSAYAARTLRRAA